MRLLVCGSRTWTNYEAIFNAIVDIMADTAVDCIIEGEAKGADSLARRAAEELDIPVLKFPADWKTHRKQAGFIRNKQMLVEGIPDLVLAFQVNRSAGTQATIDLARAAGIPVKVYEIKRLTCLVVDGRIHSEIA